MSRYGLDAALAARLFDTLRENSFDGIGITRESYAAGESRALDLIEREASALGLECRRDAAANLVCRLEGSEPSLPAAACGSHLDSVPQGGNFDGAAGVVAGLLALARLRDEKPRRPVLLFALRGEESAWFGRPYLGSSAAFGLLDATVLATPHMRSGRPLIDCMADAGADAAQLRAGTRLLDPATLRGFLELHIEQGPVLVARNLPVSVVTGIRGNLRHRAIACIGEAGHSGAVPRWLRHDAVFAVAELLTELDRSWQSMLGSGQDLVLTAGMIGTDPAEHALARIPGLVRFSFEARSESAETLNATHDLLLHATTLIAEERGVRFELDRRIDTPPARMDAGLVAGLLDQAERLGLPRETMPSGAGHDAAVFANQGVPSAMIFVRNPHGSHNPAEAMEMADFMAGAALLHAGLREMAQ